MPLFHASARADRQDGLRIQLLLLDCHDGGKFCHKNLASAHFNASCPHMSFVEFATVYANLYTWRFSRRYTLNPSSSRNSSLSEADVHFYWRHMHGFAGDLPLTANDFRDARRSLHAPNMLVLRTDGLSAGLNGCESGWRTLVRWLSGTRAATALQRHLQDHPSTRVANAHTHEYSPTAADWQRARVTNHFDSRLFEAI